MSMGGDFTNIVPCGKCFKCLQKRQNAWSFRLAQEQKISTSSAFITLTYETVPLTQNGLPTLIKKDFQNFMKRLRKKLPNRKIKYYACGEYGTQTQRPHYHAIMFNLPMSYTKDFQKLESVWTHGHIHIDQANNQTIRYTAGYIMKGKWQANDCQETGLIDDRTPEFALMSKKMGLNWLTPQMKKHYKETLKTYVTLSGGIPTSLPRYFRDKLEFTHSERRIMREASEQARNTNFEKLFNNNFNKEHTWKKDQVRKDEKQKKLHRLKV